MWTRVEERIFKMNSSIRQELHQEHGQETVRSSSRRHFLSRVAMGSIPLSLAALVGDDEKISSSALRLVVNAPLSM